MASSLSDPFVLALPDPILSVGLHRAYQEIDPVNDEVGPDGLGIVLMRFLLVRFLLAVVESVLHAADPDRTAFEDERQDQDDKNEIFERARTPFAGEDPSGRRATPVSVLKPRSQPKEGDDEQPRGGVGTQQRLHAPLPIIAIL